ncbi:hypothetical protein B0H14DRAFT_2649869 [Mycena olivaceomarginata]|nr:hypothetical protein B0H14DRAFT_2649869 [Mycena olivaceomarginata]
MDVAKVPILPALTMRAARFSRTQRYPDDYEEDSYPVLPSRMHDLPGEEDDDRRTTSISHWARTSSVSIYLGTETGLRALIVRRGHGRSMSIHYAESPNTNTQAAGRRSRSAHMPDLREASGVDAPIRMGDLEALFHRFSLQQEEGQREVKEYTQRLEARLTSLEHRSHAPSSDSFNGALATTGTNRVMRPRAAGGFPPSAPVVLPESDEGSIARGDSTGAAPQEEEEEAQISYRDPVRVNPATGVTYLSPFFECDVTDPRNHAICVAIAGTVDREMNVHDAEAAKRAAINDRNTRRYRRRCAKYEHIDSQVDAYAAKLRVPRSVVADLFTQELLSDEASGPEDEADETFEAWKVRMAAATGHKNLTAVALKKEHFVEVLESLHYFFLDADSVHQGLQRQRRCSHQVHSRANSYNRKSSLVPCIAPWDFGISSQWLAEQRNDPEVADSLFDWGTHGNPKGCEWEDVRIVRIDATGEKVVDSRFDFEGLAETEHLSNGVTIPLSRQTRTPAVKSGTRDIGISLWRTTSVGKERGRRGCALWYRRCAGS